MSSDDYQVQNIFKYSRKSYKKNRRMAQDSDISPRDINLDSPDGSPRSDRIIDSPGCSCDLDPNAEIANLIHKKCPVITLAQQQLQRLLDETDKLLCDNNRCCSNLERRWGGDTCILNQSPHGRHICHSAIKSQIAFKIWIKNVEYTSPAHFFQWMMKHQLIENLSSRNGGASVPNSVRNREQQLVNDIISLRLLHDDIPLNIRNTCKLLRADYRANKITIKFRSVYDFIFLCKMYLSQDKCRCIIVILVFVSFLTGVLLGAASCGSYLGRFNSPILTCIDNFFMTSTYSNIEDSFRSIV